VPASRTLALASLLIAWAACGGKGGGSVAQAPGSPAGRLGTSSGGTNAPSTRAAAANDAGNSSHRTDASALGSPDASSPAHRDDGNDGGAASTRGTPGPTPALSHALDPIVVTAGQEQTGVCQSWTVGNDQPLHVNKVVSSNDGAFHHSNWIWVPDTMFDGPDGTWPCADRGFDQILAGATGGVFFAQSTQALTDTQAFPPGVAFEMPAHVRIIGDVHLMNTTQRDVTTRLRFDIYTLPASDVRVPLQPMAFTNTALDIAASGETKARMQCATPQPDFDIYYILPHFHVLGRNMAIDVSGGPLDGKVIYRSTGTFGEAWGQTFDPPIAVSGALGLGVTCDYQNPRAAAVHYGEGDQEMCVTLIYSSGSKAGGAAVSNLTTTDSGGVHSTDALCVSVGTP
jgi:hypothetical protein